MSKNYDFIVVGGGSSGSSLAAILASKGPTLLIERGANHTVYPLSSISQGYPQIWGSGSFDFNRDELGSGHWIGTPNILGGGSAMNGGACWRGERSIFESMELNYTAVQDAFKYIEDRICLPLDDTEYMSAFVRAWEETGFVEPSTTESGGSWEGVFSNLTQDQKGFIQKARTIMPTSNHPKRRPASHLFEKSFVDGEPSILDQGNLTVYLMTKVKKVVINKNKEAIGVDVQSPTGDFVFYVRSGGNIFLNAGVYESPKILMLSGIGPSEVLSSLDIPIVYANDNVGKKFVDRKEFVALIPSQKRLQGDDSALSNYAAFTEDSWTTPMHKFVKEWGIAANGCASCSPENRTELCAKQILGGLLLYGINAQQESGKRFASILVGQRRPVTRGFVSLKSSDYNDAPLVHDGWSKNYEDLSEDALHDLEIITNAADELISDVLRQSTLLEELGNPGVGSQTTSNVGEFPSDLVNLLRSESSSIQNAPLDECVFAPALLPGNICTSWSDCVPTMPQLYTNDKDILSKTIFQLLLSMHQGSGTCRAGDVVEKKTLAVKGVSGLYISDLSVVAQPVDTHPMLTAMSLGVVLGNSVESLPSGNFELFPIFLSLVCCTSVTIFILWTVSQFCFAQKSNSFLHDKKEGPKSNISVYPLEIADSDDGSSDIIALSKRQKKNTASAIEDISAVGLSDKSDDGSSDIIAISNGQNLNTSSVIKHISAVGSSNDNDTLFMEEPASLSEKSLLMRWNDVSCTYVQGKKTKISEITTLFHNFGSLREGELTAIMGPSGASKSTLLDILSGRKSLGQITGNFNVFGQEVNATVNGLGSISQLIKGHSAYIPQQEFFYPTQTVEEAVAFAVNMKFGKAENIMERTQFIHSCLDAVGLHTSNYSSRKIGGGLAGGITIRGLSGGERKRLALASVLALKPKILFIDELTSGLDSENALIVMKLLKDLSIEQKVASMVIIHQPSPKVFSLFDNLVLLSRGRCLYSGSCTNLSTFYETNFDEGCPIDAHLPDDLIVKASEVIEPLKFQGERIDFMDNQNNPDDIVYDLSDGTKGIHHNSFSKLKEYTPPSSTWKLIVVFKRNLANQYVRNIANVGARIASYSLLSALIGAIFFKVGESGPAGLTFEEADLVVRTNTFLLNTSYLLPFCTIPVFVGDKRFFASESALGLYPPWIYGMSQIILEAIFVTIASIAQTCIVVPMCTMLNPSMPPWISFMTVLSALVTSGLVGSTIVFFCSMALPTQDMAFIFASTIVTISLALSGGFLPFGDMLPLSYSIQWFSPVKYSLQTLLIAQLMGTSAERILDVKEYNTPTTVAENLMVLLGIFIVLSVLSAVAMIRVREQR